MLRVRQRSHRGYAERQGLGDLPLRRLNHSGRRVAGPTWLRSGSQSPFAAMQLAHDGTTLQRQGGGRLVASSPDVRQRRELQRVLQRPPLGCPRSLPPERGTAAVRQESAASRGAAACKSGRHAIGSVASEELLMLFESRALAMAPDRHGLSGKPASNTLRIRSTTPRTDPRPSPYPLVVWLGSSRTYWLDGYARSSENASASSVPTEAPAYRPIRPRAAPRRRRLL